MALLPHEQLKQQIDAAHAVLVVTRKNPTVDQISAALAVGAYIKQLGKTVDVVSTSFSAPENLSFLPEIASVKGAIGNLHEFMISLPLGEENLGHVRHEYHNGQLTVYVTPQHGVIDPAGLTTISSAFRYDAIIAVGAPDLASLGSVYMGNTALFNTAPILAINSDPAHEFFGHVNYVRITATSVCEVVNDFLTEAGATMTGPIANLLLTGMIAATQSFKTANVNARTLQTASALIGSGADREKIVHALYRQRSVATLKLWGAALTNLQSDPQQPLLWSTLTREDFARAGAGEHAMDALVEELISTAPHAKVFALVYESPVAPHEVRVLIDTQKPYNAAGLSSGFSGGSGSASRMVSPMPGYSLGDAVQKVTNVLRARMRG